jgi:hypothetical protein
MRDRREMEVSMSQRMDDGRVGVQFDPSLRIVFRGLTDKGSSGLYDRSHVHDHQ